MRSGIKTESDMCEVYPDGDAYPGTSSRARLPGNIGNSSEVRLSEVRLAGGPFKPSVGLSGADLRPKVFSLLL